MNYKLNNKEVWTGEYKGVTLEINHWTSESVSENHHWTFYLYLTLGKIPAKYNPESFWLKRKDNKSRHVFYDYYKHPIIGNIVFHGGITYYEKETSEDYNFEDRVIKIGCDFQHYGDDYYMNGYANIKDIIHRVEESIDSLRELMPDYKYWCSTVGGYWDISEGEFVNGHFRSFKGAEWHNNNQLKNKIK